MVAGAEGEVEVVEEKEREGWREEGQEERRQRRER